MPKIPFIGPSYTDRSLSFDAQRSVNYYPIKSETNDSKDVVGLRATPGLFVGLKNGEYIGYNLDAATPVAPPPAIGVPSGQPFIIDLSFPGLCSDITSGPIYTFLQDVMFPMSYEGAGFNALFIGSSVTITQNSGFPGGNIVDFVLNTNTPIVIPSPTDITHLELQLANDGVIGSPQTGTMPVSGSMNGSGPSNALGGGFFYTGNNTNGPPSWTGNDWMIDHYFTDGSGNEFIIIHSGESLYLNPLTNPWGIPTFFQDLSLHLVGTAV